MVSNAGVFVLTDHSSLVSMQVASFASENDFQDLLAKFPALLAGEQINVADPRRFVLIDREYPIGSQAGETARWSLDHLFLDQDGIPTLVEVKRGTDTRIRREVVGQMMDYAANAVVYWPAEMLRDRFIERCATSGREPRQALVEEFGGEVEWEPFWEEVRTNLQSGRIRLLFVADVIPPELRKVVEFLNAQMRPAEVLAVELRQYAGGDLKTLAPIVLGQTQATLIKKSGEKARKQWDEHLLLASLAEREPPDAVNAAKSIISWIKSHADRWIFNDAPSFGAITAELAHKGALLPIFKIWTDGNLQLQFNVLARSSAYESALARNELLQKIIEVTGFVLKPDSIDKSPCIKLTGLTVERCTRLLELFDHMRERIREIGT